MANDTITFSIDKDLKTELKLIAVKQNLTITEILTNFIQDYVDENK